MSSPANSWRELTAAAREIGIAPDRLRELCESDDLDAHGAAFGSTYLVARHSIDKLKARLAGDAHSQSGQQS